MRSTRDPRLTIIVPTHNRPHLLRRAVESALAQTLDDVEVVVVDDGSAEPVGLSEQPRLRAIRLPVNRGVSAARNVGARVARGHWVAHLDDDDELLPHFAEVSLTALAQTTLPKPVAVLSGLEVVNEHDEVVQTHFPPTLPRGSYFGLEKIDPRLSYWSKSTLVVEREVLLGIGGFDESFTSLVYTEMFLRLNPVCSILGLPVVTYREHAHEGPQISRSPSRRLANFDRLISKYEQFLKAHPRMFATLILRQAYALYQLGQPRAALLSASQSLRRYPRHSVAMITAFLWRRLWRLDGP